LRQSLQSEAILLWCGGIGGSNGSGGHTPRRLRALGMMARAEGSGLGRAECEER
jgi:hypothetical protein